MAPSLLVSGTNPTTNDPPATQSDKFKAWIEAFAGYLRTRQSTNPATKIEEGQYDEFLLVDGNNQYWNRVVDEDFQRYAREVESCIERSIPVNDDNIARSREVPMWLCNKQIHNGNIPVPDELSWRCSNKAIGYWVYYGFGVITADLLPEYDSDFWGKFAAYGVRDWGDTAAMIKIFEVPAYKTDMEIISAAEESASDGYDIKKLVSAIIVDLAFGMYREKLPFRKFNFDDWSRICFVDSKMSPCALGLGSDFNRSSIGETICNFARLLHDIQDYIPDVVHSEWGNYRVQHDLSCEGRGCMWSELNRLAYEIETKLGRTWFNRYNAVMLWWQVGMGRYHALAKLCYAVRYGDIVTPVACKWTGHPAFTPISEVPHENIAGPVKCGGPCVKIPELPKTLAEATGLVGVAIKTMYNENVCYECALKVADRGDGCLQAFSPWEVGTYYRQNLDRIWDMESESYPIFSMHWGAIGQL
ncbi:hypothetical protein TWF694_005041 [Orbilia ellipsospora]|uniref:Uncharacterized protein n=1 Tax=Orbilia ellipsospora TaxID=2528407 RepID=A0AAV9WVS5_9PEZI